MISSARPTLLLLLALLLQLAQSSRARSPSRARSQSCGRAKRFVVGSFTTNRYATDFSGAGLVFVTHEARRFKITNVVSPRLVGDNPSYVAKFRGRLYTCSSMPPGRIARVPMRATRPSNNTVATAGMRGDAAPSHVAVLHRKVPIVVAPSVDGASVHTFRNTKRRFVSIDVYRVPPRLASMQRFPGMSLSTRQMTPHPHMTHPYGRGVLVPDLGSDVVHYLSVSRRGAMRLVQRVKLRAGDGPRHAATHHASRVVYVVNELSRTIVSLCPTKRRRLRVCGRVKIMRKDRDGIAAAIRVSADGRFLYATVRTETKEIQRHGVIAAFALSRAGRISTRVGQWSTRGVHPRDFYLVENMRVHGQCRSYAAIANRDSDNVVFLRRDSRSGKLGKRELVLRVHSPSSVLPL